MSNPTIFTVGPTISDLDLHMVLSACKLEIAPAAGKTWVSGGASVAGAGQSLRVAQDGGTIRIIQNLRLGRLMGGSPGAYSFALGRPKPYALTLELSAADSRLDLGGLPLTRLTLQQAASNQVVSFSAPNPQPLHEFTAKCLAANLVLTRLLDANFDTLAITAASSNCVLVCGGELRRDAAVTISALMSSIVVQVPATVPLICQMNVKPGSVQLGDGFERRGAVIGNAAGLAGGHPRLAITCEGLMSSLRLVSTRSE